MDVEAEPVLLAERVPSSADSLVSTNVADDMANEQTWPTEEEMAGALQGTGEGEVPDAKKGTTPKRIKRIPKGMTEYQASWIVDESEDEDQDEELEDRDGEGGRMDEDEDEEMVLDDALDAASERKSVVAFQELDMEEEQKQCVLFPSCFSARMTIIGSTQTHIMAQALPGRTRRPRFSR
jgi:pre-rRNA-processing protein TSR1